MNETTLQPRKMPRQKRSTQLVDDIVKGAIRVLKQQGGRHFTTIRVARETGISVGSLYQYFPNKESILFQVQRREWQETSDMLLAMLDDRRHPPPQRLRRTIDAFFQTEWEEVNLRTALAETGVILRETEEFREITARVYAKMSDFLAEMDPEMNAKRRRFVAEFVFTTIASLDEEVTSRPLPIAEIRHWAAISADMVSSYLSNPAALIRRGRRNSLAGSSV
jgi:AcrR family transcriptional regulator